MRPLAVDLVLLRSSAPDLQLVVGRALAARVVERRGQHGIISLAGAYLTAELPDEVQAGDRLRLVVQDTSNGRATFALAQEPPSGAQVPPAPVAAPHQGADHRVVLAGGEREGGADGERAHVVALRFEGAALGTVELRVALDDALVHARAALAGGPGLELARARTAALRAALAGATGRAAEAEVVARPRPVDVYG